LTPADRIPAPTFVIIGAQKSATRWLRLNLGRHPEVFTPDVEPSFFNTPRYERGFECYRTFFDGWNGEPIVGEATPGYMIWRHRPELVAERIDRDLPDVRLLAILRDPVDRLYSAFIHHMRRKRIDPEMDLLELVRATPPDRDPLQLVAGGWYASSLKPYFDRFGSRLQVSLNDDAKRDPRAVYEGALAHIGVEPGFEPERLDEIVFSRAAPAESRYWREGDGRRSLTSAERAALLPYFSEEIDRLEDLLQRDLTTWKKP
jgi:hypothetical protein